MEKNRISLVNSTSAQHQRRQLQKRARGGGDVDESFLLSEATRRRLSSEKAKEAKSLNCKCGIDMLKAVKSRNKK